MSILQIIKWLPKVTRKPNAKCFDYNFHQPLAHVYDEILDPKWEYYYKFNKHAYATIDVINPLDYLDLCVYARGRGSVKLELAGCNKDTVIEYANLMANGELFPLCYIDTIFHNQEGRHRALAAASLGVNRMPVVFIEPWDYKAQHEEFDFNKNLVIEKGGNLIDIKSKNRITKFYGYPKNKKEAEEKLSYFKE